MTGVHEPWYLDRLRAELERTAAEEYRRERRGVLGRRFGFPPRPVLAALAAVLLAALVVGAAAMLSSNEGGRSASPAPTPAPTTPKPDPQTFLRRLDGLYIAQIAPQTIARMGIRPPLPSPGLWRLKIDAAGLDLVLSAPEVSGGGDTAMVITGAGSGLLALAPDGNCELPAQRTAAASVHYARDNALLTFRGVRGGCRPIWTLLTSAPWRKA